MATKLEKDITRETTVKVEDRELLITLTADQKISLKPKGLGNSHIVDIEIKELYESILPTEGGGVKKPYSDEQMISIIDLRAQMMVADISFEDKVIFSNFVRTVIASINKNNKTETK